MNSQDLCAPRLVDGSDAGMELPAYTGPIRRILKHPRLMHHHRRISLVGVANLVLLRCVHDLTPHTLAIVAQANFALAVVVRQHHVINFLYWLATRAPTAWPLTLRWTLAKVYHFGGVHVGVAVSGTLWDLAFVVSLTADASVSTANLVVSSALVVLLVWANTVLFVCGHRVHAQFADDLDAGGDHGVAVAAAPDTGQAMLSTPHRSTYGCAECPSRAWPPCARFSPRWCLWPPAAASVRQWPTCWPTRDRRTCSG
ncbi:MAG: hypothetical protein ACRDQX_06550 [Pseudonocardiaceae bacterium]